MRLWTTGERLAALGSYDILDTPPEAAFDDVVEIARALTGAPVALISFVETERQWFKAKSGTDLQQTPIDTSFCALAIGEDADVLVVPDARIDARTRDMSIVAGEPGVRAYAGVVLRSSLGVPLGTVCVLDVEARDLTSAVPSLKALARQVSGQLELRRVAREHALVEAGLREANIGNELAMQAARLGRWDHRPLEHRRFYDPRAREIMGIGTDDDISFELMLQRVHPEDAPPLHAAVKQALNAERVGPMDIRFRVVDDDGAVRWVSAVGRSFFQDGRCSRFLGVLRDVTAEARADELRTLLAAELSHRVKNVVTVAQALVDSTLREADDLVAAREAAARRLRALSQAHELLMAEAWEAALVDAIVARALEGLGIPRERVAATGPAVRLASGPALQLALALHELGTNAAKYGALSNEEGRLVIDWEVTGPLARERFFFHWREEGGPPVRAPTRRGFGARLLGRATTAAFGGEVQLDYAVAGVRWSIDAPMSRLREDAAA